MWKVNGWWMPSWAKNVKNTTKKKKKELYVKKTLYHVFGEKC